MSVNIALLRAVNVGGISLKMAALADLAEEVGLERPTTLLQSGNLVFRDARARKPAELEALLESALDRTLGLTTTIFVRTAREWQGIVAANPLAAMAADDPAHLLLLALKAKPAPDGLAALRAAIKGRETVQLSGAAAYAAYPDGIGTSKLTNTVIERHLGTKVTGRNWNTVLKLAALSATMTA
jgi:uncharacterized protein (DUF1697 family)